MLHYFIHFLLITLDIAIAEVGNVARKQVAFCSADKDKTLAALKKCERFISEACELIRVGGSDLGATSRTRVKDIYLL